MSVRHDSGPFINYDEQLINVEAAYVTKLRLLESILSKLNQTEYVPSTHKILIERSLIYACQKYTRELDLLHVQSISLRNTIFEQKNKHLEATNKEIFEKQKRNHKDIIDLRTIDHDQQMADLQSEMQSRGGLFNSLDKVTMGTLTHLNNFHNAVAHWDWQKQRRH